MSVLLSILLWILAVLGGLLLALLLLPFGLRAAGSVHQGRADGRFAAGWAWGLISLRLARDGLTLRLLGLRIHRLQLGGGQRGRARQDEQKQKAEKDKQEKKEKKDKQDAGEQGGARGLLRHRRTLLRMIGRLIRALHVRGRLRGTVGLDDPADTAYVALLLALLAGRTRGLALEVDCDYTDEQIELDGWIGMRIWIIELGLVALGLLLRKRNRRALRAMA